MPVLSLREQAEFDQKIEALRQRMFIAAGQRGDLKVEAFVPATGIGKFDAVYSPQRNRLDINIKTSFAFQTKMGKGDNAENEVAWTDELEKQEFTRNAVACASAWNERYVIACSRPGWLNFHADVFVNMVVVPPGQEYYVVKVHKIAKPKSSGGINHGAVPHECGVNNWANEVDGFKKADQIFNYKEGLLRARLQEGKADRSGDFVAFNANSTTLAADDVLRLRRFAQYMHANRTPEVAGIKAYVIGLTGKKDSVFASNLKKNRAAEVVELLNERRIGGQPELAEVAKADEPWAREALALLRKRPANPSNSFGGVLIVITTAPGVDRVVPRKYVVMSHEVGHMLGLPDEYMGTHSEMTRAKLKLDAVVPATFHASKLETGDARKQRLQEGLITELNRANVAAPLFMGNTGVGNVSAFAAYESEKNSYEDARAKARAKLVPKGSNTTDAYDLWKQRNPEPSPPTPLVTISSSIMHSGDEILPAHYVTIWSALSSITAGYIDPDQWKIVPGKGASTLRHFG